ncbi:hypothetical protein H310_02069 [Aphanomyces invadans]|uniref:Nucleoside transporter n=1 Tax=Aphanomyces invadans TaxID=157072 RepID=A0A024UP11_9STRA|nr:hypothetical protein H310_02069 [Aphanomyces invadans]ETW07587.1 hypothetical protein H310_02069 [Aphanomyces invadans]|eukprot:XP_008863680.1 hypothetical protein H310_02069 [Aphanomyces invadans]
MADPERAQLLPKGGGHDNELDEKRLAFRLFTAMGFAYLFSYFALLQPVDYWTLLFPSFNAEFEIAWVYNVASVSTLVMLLWQGGSPSYNWRIVGGFATILTVMVALPVSHFVLSTTKQHLAMVLGSTAIISVSISTVDSTVLSLASLFPVGAMEATQVGMGWALFVSALYRVATKMFLYTANSVVPATMLYFGVTVATVAGGFLAFLKLRQLSITQRYVDQARATQVVDLSMWSKLWFNECMVALSFGITYALYPGVLTSIPSYNFPALNASGWWPLVLMTTFAGCEALGRSCVRWRLATHQTIWKLVLPRLMLIPVVTCAAKGFVAHDVISVASAMILGWSNGYVGTLAVVVTNDCVDAHEQSVTGMFASLGINVGILAGATVSLVASKIVGL